MCMLGVTALDYGGVYNYFYISCIIGMKVAFLTFKVRVLASFTQ